jgi:pimeloyl-ACP methyl ester carboxylesterase
LLLAMALAAPLLPQVYTAGPQVVTFFSSVDDSDQPYALYVPRDFDKSRKYPLVISLHGAYSNHRLNLRRVFGKGNLAGEADREASRYFPRLPDVDYLVASPFARGTMGYRGIAEKDVYDVLADVRKRFPVDENRIYLTGLSMGGGGALWIGLTRPDIWAAIAAVCPFAPEDADALAPNARNLAVHLFHGALDPLIPVAASRAWQKRLAEAGVAVEYAEYPTVRHNAWDWAYKDAAIFSWFAKYRRDPFPAQVRFRTSTYKYGKAYWVEATGLTPGEPAFIDARFTGQNKLTVETSRTGGFALHLAGHPMYSAAQPVEVTIDGTRLRVKAAAFSRKQSTWSAAPYTHSEQAKRAGMEGPLSEVIASRHLYVYGTSGAAGEAKLAERREQAAAAANWSGPRAPLMLNLRVLADREVNEYELRHSNLLLFGTKETNLIIERLAGRLPLHLNAGAADYGLLYVWPVDGRYVAINSGLPFYTGIQHVKRKGLVFRTPFQLMETFEDFILFKGSLENVIAEGRFDANWGVPENLRAPEAARVVTFVPVAARTAPPAR